MKLLSRCIVLCALLLLSSSVLSQAQPIAVQVPNVTGLTVPAAAAQLNRAGLRLGNIGVAVWSEAIGAGVNTVESQSLAPESVAAPGAAVDLNVWRVETVTLLYDQNAITLQNLNDTDLSLRRVLFRALDSTMPTAFDAANWRAGTLRARQCVQLWAVQRNGPQAVEGCSTIQTWAFQTRNEAHFWTGANAATAFEVVQDGVQRGICTVANLTCTLYLAPAPESGIPPDVAEYVYFLYTPDALYIINRTSDRWLSTDGLRVGGQTIGDSVHYDSAPLVARLQLLAPGQCLLWQSADAVPNATPPCEVIAQATLTRAEVFWTAAFRVNHRGAGKRRDCPAAATQGVALCLLPRLEAAE